MSPSILRELLRSLCQEPRYVAAKRFVQDPAAERERQRQELLADLEAKGLGFRVLTREVLKGPV